MVNMIGKNDVGDNIVRNKLVGKYVQLILDDKFFYHGVLLDYNDRDIVLRDIKNGEMSVSRNRKYVLREMTPQQKLELASRMDTLGMKSQVNVNESKLTKELEMHRQAFQMWQEENRAKLAAMFDKGKKDAAK